MKKLLLTILLTSLAACATTEGEVKTGKQPAEKSSSSCENIRGVKDPENGGNIYYTKSHRLYDFIKLDPAQGDKNFCSMEAARKGGFSKEAPEYFKDSMHNYASCLESEGENGTCHTYASGIYQSLKIYGKACGPNNITNAQLADAIISNAKKAKNGMDVSKYHGATSGILKRYSCR